MNHQKILSLFLSVAVVLSALCTTARGQAQSAEDARIARLAGVGESLGNGEVLPSLSRLARDRLGQGADRNNSES